MRRGFSLLEVILSLAILAGAIAGLGEVARMALHNADVARDLTRAELLCESKLAEILAGADVPDPVQGGTLETDEDDRRWLYSIDNEPIEDLGLIAVRVTVTQDLPPEQRPAAASLTRWIQDPNADFSSDSTQDSSSSGSGSSSSSGSNSSGSGSSGSGSGSSSSSSSSSSKGK